MVLGKKVFFSIGNGAEFWPLEKGIKCPATIKLFTLKFRTYTIIGVLNFRTPT